MSSFYIGLCVVGALILIYLCYMITKFVIRYKKAHPKEKKINVKTTKKQDKTIRSGSLVLKTGFITKKEVEFIKVFSSALPINYLILPQINIYDLVSPVGSRVRYEKLIGRKVDFCIFDVEKMRPLLVIDLFDDTFVNQELFVEDPLVVEALKEVKLPIVKVKVQKVYSQDEIFDIIKKYITK